MLHDTILQKYWRLYRRVYSYRKFRQNRYYKLSIFLAHRIAHDCLFFVHWLSKSIGYRCFRARLNTRHACRKRVRVCVTQAMLRGVRRERGGGGAGARGHDLRDRTISVSRKRVTRAKLLRKFHGRRRKREGKMGSVADGRGRQFDG